MWTKDRSGRETFHLTIAILHEEVGTDGNQCLNEIYDNECIEVHSSTNPDSIRWNMLLEEYQNDPVKVKGGVIEL